MPAQEGAEKRSAGNDTSVDPLSSESLKLTSKAASDLDDTYDLYQRHAGESLDPQEAKRVLRKIDRRVLPVLIVIYLLQYLDKNGINYAAVYGLEKDTGLTGQVSCDQQNLPRRSWADDHVFRTTHGWAVYFILVTWALNTLQAT